MQATTGALSTECAFVRCLVPPRPKERISMRLYLPGEAPLRMAATVRARSGRETGMGFWADFDPLTGRALKYTLGLKEPEETVVVGHTVCDAPLIGPGFIAIDTGCAFGGCLTAVQLPEKRFFQEYA